VSNVKVANRLIVVHFFQAGQFNGLAGSFGPSQPTILVSCSAIDSSFGVVAPLSKSHSSIFSNDFGNSSFSFETDGLTEEEVLWGGVACISDVFSMFVATKSTDGLVLLVSADCSAAGLGQAFAQEKEGL
jgi:hypothetical protein